MQEGRGQYENVMADKTPVRVVFNASNVATGLAEFQTGDTVPIASGGTGLSSIGSAGQVLKVNAAGSALEFGAEGDISITNLVAPSNADLTFTTSGTGNIVLDGITVRGTTINSADSSIININEGVIVDGTLNTSGQATLSGLSYPTSDGTVGQFLKTDGSGTLSFADLSLGDLTIVGSTITTPSNADFVLDPSGTGKVSINGAYTLPSSDGSANQFLKTDGSGTLAFADLSLGDLTITGSTISTPSNADLTLTPGGTGESFYTSGVARGGNPSSSGADGKAVVVFNIGVQGQVKVGGDWKNIDQAFFKVSGVWKQITAGYVKIGGAWKALFNKGVNFIATAAGFGDSAGSSSSGGGGSGGGGCFIAGTMISMADGTYKPVEQVDIGDTVSVGGKVFATGKFLIDNLYDYNGIKVSGTHMVKEDGAWLRVEDSRLGVSLGDDEVIVYVFGNENRRIIINGTEFTDYFELSEQQELLNHGEDIFSNWQDHDRQIHDKNVNILNA